MPIRVCCVALNAYPAIDPRLPGGFGGIETRSWLFARGLAQLPDIETSFVVRHSQPLRQPVYDNVRMILLRDRLYPVRDSLLSRLERRPRFPWVRLRRPRLSDAWWLPLLAARKAIVGTADPLQPSRFYESIDADLFLTFGVQSNSATVIASARRTGRPAVLFLGSDSDLDERYARPEPFVSVYRDRGDVCLWTLRNADRVLCQTPQQAESLAHLFQRSGDVVANPIDLEEWDALAARPADPGDTAGLARYALWVGRADAEHKRPGLLLELARRCPGIDFLMIMNPRDDLVDAEIRHAAPGNVRILSRVAFPAMPAVLRQAAVLVNTSSLEGFSNVFLQAAASGAPIASLNVAPEFCEQSAAGFCARGDLDSLARFLQETWTHPWPAVRRNQARRFVETHHSLPAQAARLGALLRETAARTAARK